MRLSQVILIYTIALSVVLLGMRPYLYAKANIPFSSAWNFIAEEEEEQNKKHSENEKDGEEKISGNTFSFTFNSLFIRLCSFSNPYFLDEVHLPYPGPPPRS